MDPSRDLLRSANQARDGKDYAKAARQYVEYLAVHPKNARIQIQAGHMHKELGSFVDAGRHYLAAAELMPDDADLQVQLGHFYKVTDRLDDALKAYQRAVELAPDSQDAHHQLAVCRQLQQAPDRTHASPRTTMLARAKLNSAAGEFLRNVPAATFDDALAQVAESRRYYLLEGIEQRFPDRALNEASAIACIGLCVEAQAPDVALRIVDCVLRDNPNAQIPLTVLRRCLDQPGANGSATVQAPLMLQLSTIAVATNMLARQRALIDQLAPMP